MSDEYNDDLPSKSQRKREADHLQEQGLRLMDLKPRDLARLPLNDALIRAIEESQRITKREARRRHAQYVGRLMRETDGDRIIAAMDSLQDPLRQQRLLDWSDRAAALASANDSGPLLEEMLGWYPDADRQHLRNLVRNLLAARPPEDADKAARQPFQRARRKLLDYLNELERNSEL